MKFSKSWSAFILLKIIYTFVALYVYIKFSTLGDTFDYLQGNYFYPEKMLLHSTYMIGTVAHFISSAVGDVATNLSFCFLSILGLRYALNTMNLNLRELQFVLLILSFPTFGIWTSIASKEAVSVLFMGLIFGNVYHYSVHKKVKSVPMLMLGLYLCMLFKPLYMIPIFAIGLFLVIGKKLRAKALGWSIILVTFFIISAALIYFSIDFLNDIISYLPLHFSSEAKSTRENIFWLRDYDILNSAPLGVFLAITGPTFTEALEKTTHFISLIESYILMSVYGTMLFYIFIRDFVKAKINVYYIGFLCAGLIWLLLVNYPFGVLNPGSALRYRSNYSMYSLLLILAVYKRFGAVKAIKIGDY